MVDAPPQQGNGPTTAQGSTALPIFYRRPRPLNSEVDRGKSLLLAPDHGFARGTNSLVLHGGEFRQAMRFYPIVFSVAEPVSAFAVVGLVDNENLFVGTDGRWASDAYIPAYVRRYPFILMEQPGSAELIVCFDEESSLVVESAERPLFEAGQPTRLLQDAIGFCREFHAQHAATTAFVRALAAEGLLVRNEARIVLSSSRQMTLRGFDVVDEAKFDALPDEIFLDWRRRGWIHLVYCHLMSMGNFARMVDLAAKRGMS
ncbi:MAG TPA: SapC family protein [Stellaceae bacterium]|nr:SapC family protein [Stellaceae bacterium]